MDVDSGKIRWPATVYYVGERTKKALLRLQTPHLIHSARERKNVMRKRSEEWVVWVYIRGDTVSSCVPSSHDRDLREYSCAENKSNKSPTVAIRHNLQPATHLAHILVLTLPARTVSKFIHSMIRIALCPILMSQSQYFLTSLKVEISSTISCST